MEQILLCLCDPVSVVRAESVSQLWRYLVHSLVRKGRLKKTRRTLQRLKTTESFNESSSIKETKRQAFKVIPAFLPCLTVSTGGLSSCSCSGEDPPDTDGDDQAEVSPVPGQAIHRGCSGGWEVSTRVV